MTVALELAKKDEWIEYFITIEGIGWPTNGIRDLSGGFSGDVWATNDLNADLANQLGCTIHKGLLLPSSISEKLDPRTCQLSRGGLGIDILDSDDWWLGNYTPRKVTTAETTTTAALEITTTTITLADATYFSTGSLAWLGMRELVKLGTKASATFTGCTRGYLGTKRGSILRQPESQYWNYWPAGTSVRDIARWWIGRKIALWAHVPGESASECIFLFGGKLRNLTNPDCGYKFKLDCVSSELFCDAYPMMRCPQWTISNDVTELAWPFLSDEYGSTRRYLFSAFRILTFSSPAGNAVVGSEVDSIYTLATFYNYRNYVRGGLDGAVSTFSNTNVQATDETNLLQNSIARYMKLGDGLVFVRGEYPFSNLYADEFHPTPYMVYADLKDGSIGYDADNQAIVVDEESRTSPGPQTAVFLLDNVSPYLMNNRFTVDRVIRNHPIEILLIFLTSMDREFILSDVVAGSTASVINTGTLPSANCYAGLAVHFIGGPNKGYTRWIASNTTSSITVTDPFPSVPDVGNQAQVRNGIWDVLPFGCGMNVSASDIDFDSAWSTRINYLPGASIGCFVVGGEGYFNLWNFLIDNICKPYGILVYFDRISHKIKFDYIGQPLGDGVIDNYTEITQSDLSGVGDLNHCFANPVGEIKLKVRPWRRILIGVEGMADRSGSASMAQYVPASTVNWLAEDRQVVDGDKTIDILVRPKEIDNAFAPDERDTISINAMANSDRDYGWLLCRLTGHVALYSVPSPVWSGRISMSKYQNLRPGSWVKFNFQDVPNNPFMGARGWSNIVGRVIEIKLPLDGRRIDFDCSIELFQSISGARIAPAASVTSKAQDGNGWYFVVEDDNYVLDSVKDKDWYYFQVGDVINQRDKTGVEKKNLIITGFGSNFQSDPELAADSRVYVSEEPAAVVAGDYMTFHQWSADNTAHMEEYSAYATVAGVLGADDAAKRYA